MKVLIVARHEISAKVFNAALDCTIIPCLSLKVADDIWLTKCHQVQSKQGSVKPSAPSEESPKILRQRRSR